jgi:hypothetical protein
MDRNVNGSAFSPDVAPEFRVAGAVHLTCPAGADRSDDLIDPDAADCAKVTPATTQWMSENPSCSKCIHSNASSRYRSCLVERSPAPPPIAEPADDPRGAVVQRGAIRVFFRQPFLNVPANEFGQRNSAVAGLRPEPSGLSPRELNLF